MFKIININRIAIVIYISKIEANKLNYYKKAEELFKCIEPIDKVIFYDLSNKDKTEETRNYIRTLNEIVSINKDKTYVVVIPSTVEVTQDILEVQEISAYLSRVADMENMECWFIKIRLDNGLEFLKVYSPLIDGGDACEEN